mmetsp:Transcript_17565/g.17723  ORF Transcript_17565/g.17723 Transcript_17565/m.17723 type:complete len:90 (+) Transcript_17565:296-565(+)
MTLIHRLIPDQFLSPFWKRCRLDALGEGFDGEEYDAQVTVVDPFHTGTISRSAFLAWYTLLRVEGSTKNDKDGDDSLDTADREERAEEE